METNKKLEGTDCGKRHMVEVTPMAQKILQSLAREAGMTMRGYMNYLANEASKRRIVPQSVEALRP